MRVARAALPQEKNDRVGGKSLSMHNRWVIYGLWPIPQGPEWVTPSRRYSGGEGVDFELDSPG